ncbi:hypothetical protein FHR83_006640 [Actinoplanes campanulatus]|uniref:Uncharacterized protein n=1 Tax=Actinoplanes campanulatus TaxID=113559 RepID=A0A7W5FHS6_9ACTN|nr:hypothetical protein [Actinoplanes campanulatus]MBB3098934.1 hypothetical protein [Actinoplanes campanulatus]GGN39792.1 hypothetical protein GCM10010109_68160 [Actinoplanes campanulatus]GID40138.1 hypothetical protein Aca09nite_66440 [Actinoplanes campanulatus]
MTITTNLPASTADAALTESASLRAQHMARTDVLGKVKALSLLPDDIHASTEQAANYFEVEVEAIRKVVERNRTELETHGYRVVRGQEMKELASDIPSLTKVRALALFTRQTILNIAMLLTGSDVAQKVRGYLLKVEEQATPEARANAVQAVAERPEIERVTVARAKIEMLSVAVDAGLLDKPWAVTKTHIIAARALGEEPEMPEESKPYYVPDFLKDMGLTAKEIKSEQSWFGIRAKAYAEDQGIEVPAKRPRELPDGTIRETVAWRREHLPVFQAVWEQYYAEKYASPMFLELGGAA